ncbi:unnamed protein product [Diplocarpon coronariae]|nr:hypothetical protein JHW43_002919 [Diplocarpon mali]
MRAFAFFSFLSAAIALPAVSIEHSSTLEPRVMDPFTQKSAWPAKSVNIGTRDFVATITALDSGKFNIEWTYAGPSNGSPLFYRITSDTGLQLIQFTGSPEKRDGEGQITKAGDSFTVLIDDVADLA